MHQSSANDVEGHSSVNRANDGLVNQELKNTVKFLRQQLKTYKEEIKTLKHESTTKQITIEKQEKLIDKLRFEHMQA